MHQFSPIKNKEELLRTIESIHFRCNKLCRLVLGKYLANSGNIGVFCHADDEYKLLTKVDEELTLPSDNPNQKYFRLRKPIVIAFKGDIPKATYTHLYIRKPDPTPYGKYLGDVDFVMESQDYLKLKNALLNGKVVKGAQIYNRPGWDTIQLTDSSIDVVAYVSTQEFAEKVRVKF